MCMLLILLGQPFGLVASPNGSANIAAVERTWISDRQHNQRYDVVLSSSEVIGRMQVEVNALPTRTKTIKLEEGEGTGDSHWPLPRATGGSRTSLLLLVDYKGTPS